VATCRIPLSVLLLLPALAVADAPTAVRTLTGFEPEQVAGWGLTQADGAYQIGRQAVLRKGPASEGQWALARTVTQRNVDWGGLKGGTSEDWVRYYHGQILNATGHFPRGRLKTWLPADWSGFALLRMDVRSSEAAMRVRVMLEDEIATPPTMRLFQVPAGQWVTLEVDLAAASAVRDMPLTDAQAKRLGTPVAGIRTLNPARMANLLIVLEQCDAATEVLLDNLRLVRDAKAEKARFPLRTDGRPFPMPTALPEVTPAPPKAVPLPAAAPAGEQTPMLIDLSRRRPPSYAWLNEQVRHAITAVDERRVVLAIGAFWPWKTLDGGGRWTPMKDLQHSRNAPGAGTAAAGADLLSVYTARCAGGGQPAVIYFRKLRWDGTDWAAGEPHLVDVNTRHCPEFRVEVLRLASGRIWAAWFQDTRFRRIVLIARYSDDGGRTWRAPDSNALAVFEHPTHWRRPLPVGVTVWWERPARDVPPARANGRIGDCHPHTNLALVPYGDRVAVVWGGRHRRREALLWSRFDGRQWSPPQVVLPRYGPPSSATTLGERTVFVAFLGKVYRLDGERWIEDSPAEGGADKLVAAGGSVLCFGRTVVAADDRQVTTIWVSRRAKDRPWSAPQTLATERTAAGRKGQIHLIAPQFAAGRIVPIAWAPHHGWIKVLRVPVRR
jgi:hypothetical protein